MSVTVRTILPSVALLILIAVSTADSIGGFDESNPIRMVSDRLREVEESVVEILGQTRHALSFARFTHRYGKRYENTEEMKLRFSIFKESLDLIRSTNKKGLSYKLGVNRKFIVSSLLSGRETGQMKTDTWIYK